jgi:hypothetical protein
VALDGGGDALGIRRRDHEARVLGPRELDDDGVPISVDDSKILAK